MTGVVLPAGLAADRCRVLQRRVRLVVAVVVGYNAVAVAVGAGRAAAPGAMLSEDPGAGRPSAPMAGAASAGCCSGDGACACRGSGETGETESAGVADLAVGSSRGV